MEYELLFFTSVSNEDRVPEIKREIEEIVTGRGGKISADWNDIGKRKFAHPIKKQTHGFFSFCRFTLDEGENIAEMNRRLALNDKIMRHIIVRADEIGKPIGAIGTGDERQNARREKGAAKREPVRSAAAPDKITDMEKSAEPAPKVEMKELDEKLSEILDENPEK